MMAMRTIRMRCSCFGAVLIIIAGVGCTGIHERGSDYTLDYKGKGRAVLHGEEFFANGEDLFEDKGMHIMRQNNYRQAEMKNTTWCLIKKIL